MEIVRWGDQRTADMLSKHNAFTVEGVRIEDLEMFLALIDNYAGLKRDKVYYTSGESLNLLYGLRSENSYPTDLHIASVLKDDIIDPLKMELIRFMFNGRWYSDLISNILKREKLWKEIKEADDGMVRIIVKEPNSDAKIISVPSDYRKKSLNNYIDNNWIDFVSMSDDGLFKVGVDEDGVKKKLKTNFFMETTAFPAMPMLGTAVFSRVEYVDVFREEIEDYTLADLTNDDIQRVMVTLDEDYQKQLKWIFENKMGGKIEPKITVF